MCTYASIQQTQLSKLRTGRMPRGSPGEAVTRNTANMHKMNGLSGVLTARLSPAALAASMLPDASIGVTP